MLNITEYNINSGFSKELDSMIEKTKVALATEKSEEGIELLTKKLNQLTELKK